MIGQLKIGTDGVILDKVESAIARLKAFCPPEGYWVAFSGGKDSQCVYHLCKMAGVKFDAHYNVTSVDPPELIRFIKKNYPDVIWEYPRDKDGKVITMWNLIPRKNIPPTRMARYCCQYLKESSGKHRVTVTGVRWAESANRSNNQGVTVIIGKQKDTKKKAEELGTDYKVNKTGNIILNDDNDDARQMVEHCYRTRKTLVNPIVDWDDDDVWEFLNGNGIEHCCLYDQGHTRLGCIGCPLSQSQRIELEQYPKYRQNYMKAFERMLKANREKGVVNDWKDANDVMKWWLQDEQNISQEQAEELMDLPYGFLTTN